MCVESKVEASSRKTTHDNRGKTFISLPSNLFIEKVYTESRSVLSLDPVDYGLSRKD